MEGMRLRVKIWSARTLYWLAKKVTLRRGSNRSARSQMNTWWSSKSSPAQMAQIYKAQIWYTQWAQLKWWWEKTICCRSSATSWPIRTTTTTLENRRTSLDPLPFGWYLRKQSNKTSSNLKEVRETPTSRICNPPHLLLSLKNTKSCRKSKSMCLSRRLETNWENLINRKDQPQLVRRVQGKRIDPLQARNLQRARCLGTSPLPISLLEQTIRSSCRKNCQREKGRKPPNRSLSPMTATAKEWALSSLTSSYSHIIKRVRRNCKSKHKGTVPSQWTTRINLRLRASHCLTCRYYQTRIKACKYSTLHPLTRARKEQLNLMKGQVPNQYQGHY